MIFSQKDKERIGKNFAAIRKAYGFASVVDFAIELSYPGVSEDILRKIESGKYQIRESTIRLFGALTGFPFEKIAYDDLSGLEPNSLVYKDINISDTIYDEDVQKDYREFLKTIFPIVSNDRAMKSKEFREAYNICINKILMADFDEDDVVNAVNLFIKSSLNNSIPEAYVNILSAFGCLYIHFIYFSVDKKIWDKFVAADYENIVDFFKKYHLMKNWEANIELSSKSKRLFLDSYNKFLTRYMKLVAKSQGYNDFAYYFLGVRYYFGIMDNEITKISDSDMNTFGHNMLECLEIMKNKYAINFFKVINKE